MSKPARRRGSAAVDPYVGLVEAVGSPLRPRRMFGCWAYYRDEQLVWVNAAKREPWRGVLVPTERLCHATLRAELPALRVHPVLGKWLYLPARHAAFEATAERLARLVAAVDARIGVAPGRRALTSPRPGARVSHARHGGR
jgi:hypothetical protein